MSQHPAAAALSRPGPQPHAPDAALISLRGIVKSYTVPNGEVVRVLAGLDLDIPPGSFTVIRGDSGSGKTSLLRILGMLDVDFDGEYLLDGLDVAAEPDWHRDELRSANIGFVFQDGQLFDHLTLRDNVGQPVQLQGPDEARRALPRRLADLGPTFLTEKELRDDTLARLPGLVSGGQRQRAGIMRAVIARPPLILADEPTASLDVSRKQEIVDLLLSLQRAGHTVVVVSHDKIFYGVGRQLELAGGVLTEVAAGRLAAGPALPVRPSADGEAILYGWRPRAPARILLAQAVREAFLRPLFLLLILVALSAGVCQVGVVASLIVGAQSFLNDAMTRGSRLNRLQIKPMRADYEKPDRFPAVAAIRNWDTVSAIVPRRTSVARVVGADGESNIYSALGLHPGDPEYGLLDFVAGGRFSGAGDGLEIIVTAELLARLFEDARGLADGSRRYEDFLGRTVAVEVRQFSSTQQELPERTRRLQLKLVGVILYAEGGRKLYLPTRTLVVIDGYRMDKTGLDLPVTPAAWADGARTLDRLAAYPWQDEMHVYTKEIRSIIPVFRQLSRLGYAPESEVWKFKWVLDIRDLTIKVFGPLLGLISLGVALTVATNLLTSAKMREKEFARWRILGMRRGDLVFTQVVAAALTILAGTLLGLLAGGALVEAARGFLAEQNPGAGYETVFAPVGPFALLILAAAMTVGLLAAIYPALRTARTDPAKVLQS